MLTDEQFIDSVWNKYNDYIYSNNKDVYFKRHHYKNTDLIIKLSTMITYTITAFTTAGIVYAGVATYNFIQKYTTTDFNNNKGYEYNQDMIQINGIYYKKITTYKEYTESKNKWSDLIEMTEKDFENYFVIVLAGENYDTTGLYVSNVEADDDKIYIDLNKKDNYDESTVISLKLENSLNRENIEIRNNPNISDVSNKYKKMEELSSDYSVEEAIEDGCFVIVKEKILSENKEQFNDFIKNCNDGINSNIRIYSYPYTEQTTIVDLEYKNGKINMSSFNISNPENNYVIYNSGKSILRTSIYDEDNESYIYWLIDEIGNQKVICGTEAQEI